MNRIRNHLALIPYKDVNDIIHESSLVHALNNIRNITGRNLDTGFTLKENTKQLGNWIGAMGYITILDQIGKCYRPKTEPKITNEKRGIILALKYFTPLKDDAIYAIYALRNAFFHDFSLLNKDNTSNYHHFVIGNNESDVLVILPMKKWDGNIYNRNQENQTYINLFKLGDLVEKIYNDLLILENKSELSLELEGGEDELMARYIFYHR